MIVKESKMKTKNKSWDLVSQLLNSSGLRTLYLWGPPGIGKTYGAQRWGLNGRKCYTVTLTEETPASELRGHFIPKGGEFLWHDGPISLAMRQGARLILNEVAHASCDVVSILYAVLESPETSKLTLPTGEILIPEKGFQCVITDNVPPISLPAALQDRIDCSVEIDSPSPEAISSFPESLRAVVMDSATVGDISRRVSLRSWEAVDRLSSGGMDFEVAANAVFGDKWEGIKSALKIARAAKVK